MEPLSRRAVLTLALAGTATMVLASCTTPAPAPTGTAGSGKLTVWAFDETTSVSLERKFAAQFPQYELEVVRLPAGDLVQRLVVALQGGQGLPDVVQLLARDAGDLFATGQFLDMSEQLEPLRKEFLPNILMEHDEKVISFLMGAGYEGLWTHRSALEQHGLSIPPDTTWTEVRDIAEELKVASGGTQHLFLEPTGANGFLHYSAFYGARGGNWWAADGAFAADEDLAVDTLEFLVDVKSRGLAASTDWSKPEFWSLVGDGTVTAYPMNYAVGSTNLKRNLPDQSGEWQLVPWPRWEKGEETLAGLFGGSCYAGLSGAANAQGARDVIMWWLSDIGLVEQYDILGDVAYKPAEELVDRGAADPFFDGQSVVLDLTSRSLPEFNFLNWTATVSAMTNAVDQAMSGAKTPKQAVEEGLAELRSI